MKSLLFIFLLAVGVIPANAQQVTEPEVFCGKIKVQGSTTKPAVALIEELARQCGYETDYVEQYVPSAIVTIVGELGDLKSTIEKIAGLGGFEAFVDVDDKRIVVSEAPDAAPSVPQSQASAAVPAAPPAAPSTVQLPPQRPRYYPLTPNGVARRAFAEANTFAEANANVRAVTEAFEQQRLASNRYYSPTVYAVGGAYSYHQTHGYWSWMEGCISGPSGYLKYKFHENKDDDLNSEEERKFWFVSINGEALGTIDQADAWFNGDIPVCAGPTRVMIERLHKGVAMDRNFSVRPGAYTEIGVGDYLFPPEPTP